MEKLDPKAGLGTLYHPKAKDIVEVDVPPLRYLMIDGQGDPNASPAYAHAVEALFSVSYATRFKVKKMHGGCDYAVMPLEGLWWADDPAVFLAGEKSKWDWTMMILQPSFVPDRVIQTALDEVHARKGLAAVKRLRLETFDEGHCAQLLHVGPFSEEGPAIARLHAYIESRGALRGKHHEIYLSDIRRAQPAKWKTILRQPMRPAAA